MTSSLGSTREEADELSISKNVTSIQTKGVKGAIPFHIFVYENQFSAMEKKGDEALSHLWEHYAAIGRRLDELCMEGQITEHEKRSIVELSQKVINELASNYNEVKKAGEVMGGVVLELEADKWLEKRNRELAEARAEERIENSVANVDSIIAKSNKSIEDACNLIDIPVDEYLAYKAK